MGRPWYLRPIGMVRRLTSPAKSGSCSPNNPKPLVLNNNNINLRLELIMAKLKTQPQSRFLMAQKSSLANGSEVPCLKLLIGHMAHQGPTIIPLAQGRSIGPLTRNMARPKDRLRPTRLTSPKQVPVHQRYVRPAYHHGTRNISGFSALRAAFSK